MPHRKNTPRPTHEAQDTQDIQPAELEESSDPKEQLPVDLTLSSLVETQDTVGPSGIVVQPKK